MKVFFFDPEQYVSCDREPSWYELRLPILECGLVTEHRDFVYQRLIRSEGYEEMQRRALAEIADFGPDLVIYSTTWPDYLIEPWVLREIMDAGIPIYTHLWDTFPHPWPHELDTFLNCNYMGVTGSVSNYLFYKSLAGKQKYLRQVTFTAGHNVFTDLFTKEDLPKTSDVTLLGSREGARKELIAYLERRLDERGITFNKAGGLLDSTKRFWDKGLRLSDDWIGWDAYVRTINESRICINSQSDTGRVQVKGKVFDYLSCGALVLTDGNVEIRKVVPEDCVVYYEDYDDCLDKISYFLSHEDEARAVADRGHAWYHATFDYKRFWSRVLTVAVSGQGELPGLPGGASQHETRWKREATTLAPLAGARDSTEGFAPLVARRVDPDEHAAATAAPWREGSRVYCGLPWYKLELGLDCSYGPCCHYRVGFGRPPASKAELAELWNSTEMRGLRQRLLDGKIEGTPCEGCYDRFFSADHDIFGMGAWLPRYSIEGGARDEVWAEANESYKQGRVDLPNLPLELNYLTSEMCNLSCVMCTQNVDRRLADSKAALSLVADMGWERFDRLSWVGGEPLLTPDALELLDHVANTDQKGACIYITTNAMLVDRHLDKLDKIDNLFLTISIDGVGDTFEAIRKGGSWERLRANLELLREHKEWHPHWRLNFNSIVMRSTYERTHDLLELAAQVGASVFFMPINGGHPHEDFFSYPSILEDHEHFRTTMRDAIDRAHELGARKALDALTKLCKYWDLVRIARAAELPVPGPKPAATTSAPLPNIALLT